jgi:hypothetical protein
LVERAGVVALRASCVVEGCQWCSSGSYGQLALRLEVETLVKRITRLGLGRPKAEFLEAYQPGMIQKVFQWDTTGYIRHERR